MSGSFESGSIYASNNLIDFWAALVFFPNMSQSGDIRIIVPAFIVLLFLILSCSSDKNVVIPEFNGERAYNYIEKQVSFGPRVPDTEGSRECRAYLVEFFDSLGANIDSMVFVHADKATGKEIRMVNIIASFTGIDSLDKRRYLLAAHYDTRPRAEYDPDSTKRNEWIAGANDGASGVAILMELGNMFSNEKPNLNVDLAMLDGEDYGPPGHLDEYFLGGKEMVRRGIKDKYDFALVVDMIGDRDLRIYKEQFSEKYVPEWNDRIWKIARELGETAFVDSVGEAIYDDHLSFNTIEIPSIVVIDFNYPYWHTTQDTPDKCSPASLKSVGRVISTFIYRQ